MSACSTASLFTGRYAAIRDVPAGLIVPVRASVGVPRFIKAARSFPAIHELMPYGCLFKIDDLEEFTWRYRRRLEKHAAVIDARLAELHREYPGRPLVLCCFEDLSRTWCHRRVWADWHAERTGVVIEEFTAARLHDLTHPAPPADPQGSLLP
jgi:hypothetical protein